MVYSLNKDHHLLIEIQNKINIDNSTSYLNSKFEAKDPQALRRWEA